MDEWSHEEYVMDVIKTLFNKEGKRRHFFSRSPQVHGLIRERPLLFSWIREVSEQLNLQKTTFHLAVYVLDVFMDNHVVAPSKLKLLAIVCLLLAAKFEELDSNIPKISTLKEKLDSPFESTEFITIELIILKFLKWELAHSTTAHFLELFTAYTVETNDLVCCHEKHSSHTDNEKMKYSMNTLKLDVSEIIQDIMDTSLQDTTYMKFPPSIVAASIIYLARIQLSLQPPWTSQLTEITGMNIPDFAACTSWLLREMNSDEENSLKIDHGYFTSSASCSPELSPATAKTKNP